MAYRTADVITTSVVLSPLFLSFFLFFLLFFLLFYIIFLTLPAGLMPSSASASRREKPLHDLFVHLNRIGV